MGKEIERRWLVDHKKAEFIISAFKAQPYLYWQGYLSEMGNKNAIRIRQELSWNPKEPILYFLTIKGGSGLVRREDNIPIPPETFQQLRDTMNLIGMGSVSKQRYKLKVGLHTIELDVFEGDLSPLCIAEVEFKTKEDAHLFLAPTYFGREITDDKRYSNMSLAWKGLPK